MKTVIFDIDGCISDDVWRFEYVVDNDDNDIKYDKYHQFCIFDHPLPEGHKLINEYIRNGHRITFITARPEKFRYKTIRWMNRYLDPSIFTNDNFDLLMRKNGDGRDSVIIKEEVVSKLIDAGYKSDDFLSAFDDREDIVKMYRDIFGIPAYVLDRDGLKL